MNWTIWMPIGAVALSTVVNLLMTFGHYLTRRDGQIMVDSANTNAAKARADEHFERVDSALEAFGFKIDDIMQTLVKVKTEGEFREATNERDHVRFEKQLDEVFRICRRQHGLDPS